MEDIHSLLARFSEVWNEALNGNYRNRLEINCISNKLRIASDRKTINMQDLSDEEKESLKFALTLANLNI